MSNCKYETKNGRCGLKGSYAYKHKCFTEDLCKCHEPLTNADRIREMSDEELAELFCGADFCEVCDQLRPTGTCQAMETEGPLSLSCIAAALKWLQQPAGGGDAE